MNVTAEITKPQRSSFLRAIPRLRDLVLPSLFWSLACLVAVTMTLINGRGWAFAPQTYYVALIYGSGALLALLPSLYFVRLFTTKPSLWRLLLLMFFITGFTFSITAGLFALQYRAYFVQWHGPTFSQLWLWQQAFTSAGAVYTYIVLGLRLYVPVAAIALIITSWWLNRLPD